VASWAPSGLRMGHRHSILLHEVCFALFAGVAWARFALALGPASPDALLYLACLLGGAALVAAGPVLGTGAGAKLRLALYPVGLTAAYLNMGPALARAGAPLWDAELLRLDLLLTGTTPSLALQPFVRPLLTDVLSLCYWLFIPYFATSLIWYFFGGLPLARRFFAGLIGLYSVGFLGYLLVPASGPYLAFPHLYTVPLTGGMLTDANVALIAIGSNRVDVFPSLHCAASAFILAFDYRHSRGRFWLFLVPVVGLWLSTVYLRYHYLVDLLAGFTLAALAWRAVSREGRESARASGILGRLPEAGPREPEEGNA
jgi:membrane-associated phospholipid phosphatase